MGDFMTKELTKEQWQAIAEKLAEYLISFCAITNCFHCPLETCLCESKPNIMNDKLWIEQAKKELGYE